MNVFSDETIARTYDSYYQTPAGQKIDNLEKEKIKNLLLDIPRQHMLELGCGTGHWTEFFCTLGFSVTGIDLSEAMLAEAGKKNLKNATFYLGDASNLSFQNESFELIISITMLEFVGNIQKVLDEVLRILKPGGVLILGCLNSNSVLGHNKENDENFRNAHFFSKEELKTCLSKFSEPEIGECIFLNSSFDLLDGTMDKYPVEGAFLSALTRKTN